MIPGPGNEMAAAGGGDRLLVCREQVTRTLKAALGQGRLTEDEYDERMGQASAARSRAELAALTEDLPVAGMDVPARPPTAKDVRTGVSVSIVAASMAAAILLWHPDNGLAFMAFVIAAVTVLVAPIVTVGVMVDVRRQRRSGGQLPSGLRDGHRGSSRVTLFRVAAPSAAVAAGNNAPANAASAISWAGQQGGQAYQLATPAENHASSWCGQGEGAGGWPDWLLCSSSPR